MVANLTEYGKRIKIQLLEKNQTQGWLVDEVRNRTGLYFDSRYLHKVLTGQYVSPHITRAIDEILEIPDCN